MAAVGMATGDMVAVPPADITGRDPSCAPTGADVMTGVG
jgi:hypothetical protein